MLFLAIPIPTASAYTDAFEAILCVGPCTAFLVSPPSLHAQLRPFMVDPSFTTHMPSRLFPLSSSLHGSRRVGHPALLRSRLFSGHSCWILFLPFGAPAILGTRVRELPVKISIIFTPLPLL
jgi:hypothetical protein